MHCFGILKEFLILRLTPESAFVMDPHDKSLPPIFTGGDGRIPIAYVNPPDGIPILRRIITKASHHDLVSDVASIHSLLQDLLGEAARRGKTRGSMKKQLAGSF